MDDMTPQADAIVAKLEAPSAVATDPEHNDMVRDARRYRRLQILGCQVAHTDGLSGCLRFTNLDKLLDDDLSIHPSRGEASPLPPL